MEELFLIFINYIGEDWKGNHIYEFLFSDETEDIDGEEWDTYPASGNPESPHERFVKKVGKLESKLKMDLIQDSDTFAVWDSIDGVVALGWEDINDYDEYPESRLFFEFGETQKVVEDKLYEKDIILDYNKKNHESKKENN
jgi:hypothetical protein